MELSTNDNNGGGGSSEAPPKWTCEVCKKETSGNFVHILRHLNAQRLKQRHELKRDEICEKTPRVSWCERCKAFIDANTIAFHLQTQCTSNGM